MEQIIFYPLEFCNGKYAVSKCGKVKSVYTVSKLGKRRETGTILKPYINWKGYEMVGINFRIKDGSLKKQKIFVHRLVGLAFIPNPFNKPQINHMDLNIRNNHVDNLEWVTNKENSTHAQLNGRIPFAKPYIKKGWQSQYPNRWKAVIDTVTGIEYPSVRQTPLDNITLKYLRRMLNGDRKNKTNYIYKEKINH